MDYATGAPLLLDLALVLIVVGSGVRGWRSGLIAGGLGLAGQVGGAVLGLWAAPRVLARVPAGTLGPLAKAVVLLLVVVAVAEVGQALLGGLGDRLRAHGIRAVHVVDRVLGAAGALVVSVLVLAVSAAAIRPIAPPSWARTMDASRTVTALHAVMPGELTRQATRLTSVLDAAGFPRVFSGPTPEPVLPVQKPDAAATGTAEVQAASRSVLKVTSIGCGRISVGSGWVAAPERVVTNAHVVAGGTELSVQVEGMGSPRPATLVAFDPEVDLAVLRVPGLSAKPLPRAGALPDQAGVVIAGFPGGGDFQVVPGRVRGTLEATGEDIYGGQGITRQIYALRASVQQGDSGGPLLTPAGSVAGTVFARSTTDPETGYALTNSETSGLVDRAGGLTRKVPTPACLPE